MKPERLYVIIFDAVYGSLTLSYLLLTLAICYRDIAEYLVTCKQWRDTLKNCTDNMTPLRRLIIKMPGKNVTLWV